MRTTLKTGLAVMLSVFAALTAVSAQTVQEQPKKVKKVNILVESAKPGSIRQLLSFTGETSPYVEAYAAADVNGPVSEVCVEIGEKVLKNQILCKIEAKRFEIALRQAEATLAKAKQQYVEDLKDYNRNKTLFDRKAITQKSLDSALTKHISSKASRDLAQASYDEAKLNLERCAVRAPIDGYFVDRNIEIGQTMTRGQIMGRVLNLDSVYVDARISNADIGTVKIGQVCDIEEKYKGTVEYITLQADNSRAFKVRIKLPNKDMKFRANVFVKGSITVGDFKDVPMYPSAALRNDKGIDYVYKIVNNKAHRVNVTIKAQEGQMTYSPEVETGDQLTTVGQDALSEGAEVVIRN